MQAPENLGSLEITTYIALVLQGISLAQGYTYYTHSSRDRLYLKILALLLLVLDIFHSFTSAHTIYFTSVTHATDPEENSIPLSVTVGIESVITFLVEARLYFSLFTSPFLGLPPVLSGLLYAPHPASLYESIRRAPALACLIPAGMRFACAGALSVESMRDVFHKPNGIFVHVLIVACMIFYLARMFSTYNLRS